LHARQQERQADIALPFLRAGAAEELLRKPSCIATRNDRVGPPPEGFAGNFFRPAKP
jgi:hypothetical protein